MHPITKRYLIFGLISIILIAIAIILTRQRPPTAPKLPPPQEPKNFMQNLPVKLSENAILEDIPKSLPLINLSFEKITKSQATKLALNIGFPDKPQVITDINRGDIYLWKNPTDFLSINPGTNSIEYGTLTDSENIEPAQSLTKENLVKNASSFLQNSLNISPEEFEFDFIDYLQADPYGESTTQVSRSKANIYQVNFAYKSNNIKIVNLNLLESLIFVRLHSDGSISSAHINMIEKISESEQEHSLKNLENIRDSLSQATLFSLDNNNLNIADLDKESIKNISIEKITLAYLLTTPITKQLQPVFILEGKVELEESSNINALLYLPAIKNP